MPIPVPRMPGPTAAEPRPRTDPWLPALATLGVAQAAWVGWSLRVPDLNLDYPLPGGDGYDWIANALALAGQPVRHTGRPPLFPLLLAALDAAGISSLLPFLQQLAVVIVALALYPALRHRLGRVPAVTVAAFVLADETLLRQALDVMAEPLAMALLATACAAFLAAGARPRLYPLAGALGGLATLTQPATALFVPAAALTVLACRRAHLRSVELWLGALTVLALPGAWLVASTLGMPGAGLHGVRALGLFRPHLDALRYYLNAAGVLCGWPALVVAVWGVASVAWNARRQHRSRGLPAGSAAPAEPGSGVAAGDAGPSLADARLFTALLAAGIAGFFVLGYDFRGERFLLYALPPSLWWLGEGVAAIRPAQARVVAAIVVVAMSARPTPSFAAHPWLDVARFARAQRVHEAIPPSVFPEARSVVLLETAGDSGDSRWPTVYRLGNALRRRVKVAPARLYPRRWWGWSCLTGVFETRDFVLLGWACGDPPERVLLAVPQRDPLSAELAARARRLASTRPDRPEATATGPALSRPLRAAWERARRLDAALARPDDFLVAFLDSRRAPEWLRALPFVARTSSLFIVPRGGGAELRQRLEQSEDLGALEVDGCTLRRVRHRSYEMLVVESCG